MTKIVENKRKGFERLPIIGERLFSLHESLSISTQFIYEQGITTQLANDMGELVGRVGYDSQGFLVKAEFSYHHLSLDNLKKIKIPEILMTPLLNILNKTSPYSFESNGEAVSIQFFGEVPQKKFPHGLKNLPALLLSSFQSK